MSSICKCKQAIPVLSQYMKNMYSHAWPVLMPRHPYRKQRHTDNIVSCRIEDEQQINKLINIFISYSFRKRVFPSVSKYVISYFPRHNKHTKSVQELTGQPWWPWSTEPPKETKTTTLTYERRKPARTRAMAERLLEPGATANTAWHGSMEILLLRYSHVLRQS